MTYIEWIEAYELRCAERVVPSSLPLEERLSIGVTGMCGCATEDMVEAFPELQRVRGHYGPYAHWWCTAPDGRIIDPTKRQFKRQDLSYVEYDGPDPVGKCMICGTFVWTSDFTSSACSEECLEELRLEYGELRR